MLGADDLKQGGLLVKKNEAFSNRREQLSVMTVTEGRPRGPEFAKDKTKG